MLLSNPPTFPRQYTRTKINIYMSSRRLRHKHIQQTRPVTWHRSMVFASCARFEREHLSTNDAKRAASAAGGRALLVPNMRQYRRMRAAALPARAGCCRFMQHLSLHDLSAHSRERAKIRFASRRPAGERRERVLLNNRDSRNEWGAVSKVRVNALGDKDSQQRFARGAFYHLRKILNRFSEKNGNGFS